MKHFFIAAVRFCVLTLAGHALLGTSTAEAAYTPHYSYNPNAAQAITYAWDNAGRLSNTTAGGNTLSYQYDPASNKTCTTWPDGFYTSTSYDALNRPTQINENGTSTLASYAYDDLSRKSTVTLGNGTKTTRSYDPQGALASLSHFTASASTDVQYTYSRNQVRDVTGIGCEQQPLPVEPRRIPNHQKLYRQWPERIHHSRRRGAHTRGQWQLER